MTVNARLKPQRIRTFSRFYTELNCTAGPSEEFRMTMQFKHSTCAPIESERVQLNSIKFIYPVLRNVDSKEIYLRGKTIKSTIVRVIITNLNLIEENKYIARCVRDAVGGLLCGF